MKRTRMRGAATAAAKTLEMQMLVPAIMMRRLGQLQGASPLAAAFQWSRWIVEKQFAFALSGMALAQGCAQAMLGNALGGGSSGTRGGLQVYEHAARTAGRALAPLHSRVKRNARRKRG